MGTPSVGGFDFLKSTHERIGSFGFYRDVEDND